MILCFSGIIGMCGSMTGFPGARAATAWLVSPSSSSGGFSAAAPNPGFVDFTEMRRRSPAASTAPMPTGYVPGPRAPEVHSPSPDMRASELEPVYDMRDPDGNGDPSDRLLSPVKAQYTGNCWAYASYGGLESHLIQFLGIQADFSEDHMTGRAGFDLGFSDGGNADMSTAYLSRHAGPVAENGNTPLRYVDGMYFLPVRSDVRDNAYIKQAIKTWGGLYTTMQWEDRAYHAADATYFYNDPDNSFDDGNHAVVLVGWDDRKKVAGAPGDGAFIVRNSWGAQWGESGYFYISYYDESLAFLSLVAFEDRSDDSLHFDEILFYDDLGCTSSVGCGTSTAWGANRFVPGQDGLLEAVSLFAVHSDTAYTIEVYASCEAAVFSGRLWTQQGVLEQGGWHTIALNESLPITAGDDFVVAVRFNTPGFAYPVPVEMPIPGYASGAAAEAGQSYVSCGDGMSWVDLNQFFPDTNVCIKALVSHQSNTPADNYQYFFPHIAAGDGWETEVCLINPDTRLTVTGDLKAYDQRGLQIGQGRTLALDPLARLEYNVGEAFADAADIAYMVFSADSAKVRGSATFLQAGRYRTAIALATRVTERDIPIAHIASSADWWTGIALLNTSAKSKELFIQFNDGRTISRRLAGRSHQAFTVRQLFGGLPQPSLRSAVIRNAEGVVGLVLFGSTSGDLSGVALSDATATDLYFPHVAADENWWTGLVVYNPGNSLAQATVYAYAADGTLLSSTQWHLNSRANIVGTAAGLGFPRQTAWLSLHADAPVTGFELFGAMNLQPLDGIGVLDLPKQQGCFARIDRTGWTDIMLINPWPETAGVTLQAIGADGRLIAARSLSLSPHAKFTSRAAELFALNIDRAASITYAADRDVIGFQLNGSSDGLLLEALPGL